MSDKQRLDIGGSLDQALQGQVDMDLKAVLKEGWELTNLTKWVLVQGALLVLSLAMLLVLLSMQFFGNGDWAQLSPQAKVMTNTLLTALMAPVISGLVMMGVNHSVGGVSKVTHLFQFLPQAMYLSLTALMSALLVDIGMMLLILPGVYLLIATGFAIPLVIEKKLPPWRAIWYSIVCVSHQWLNFIGLYFVFAILFMLVIVTFGIAGIWVIPFYYNVKGVLYRDFFGVTVHIRGGSGDGESVFQA